MIRLTARSEDLAIGVDVDRFASLDTGELAMISFVATDSVAKSVIAMLQAGKKASAFTGANASRFQVSLSQSGYRITRAKLGRFSAVHVVAIAKVPGLMFGDLAESLEAYLFSNEINTPILPEWIPYLVEKLKAQESVETLTSYEIDAFVAEFDSQDLDRLVTEGLHDQSLSIVPRSPCHAG
jgi:hypothetical protein